MNEQMPEQFAAYDNQIKDMNESNIEVENDDEILSTEEDERLTSDEDTDLDWNAIKQNDTHEPKERNSTHKRISKLTHRINQEYAEKNLLLQEKEEMLNTIREQERKIRENEQLLLTGYKTNLEREREEYERLYDRAIEEGDADSRLKISRRKNEIDKELIKLEAVLEQNIPDTSYHQSYPNNAQYQQLQAPVLHPQIQMIAQNFAMQNPEVQYDERMQVRADNIYKNLAQQYESQGKGHLIGTPQYMAQWNSLYRGDFNKTAKHTGKANSANSINLTEEQKFMAKTIFGVDPQTGKARSEQEAYKLFKEHSRKG